MYKGLVCHGASLLVGSSTSRPPTAVGGTGEVGADGAGGAVSEVVAAVRALGLGTGQAEDYRKEHQTVKEAESHRQEEYLVLRKLKFEKLELSRYHSINFDIRFLTHLEKYYEGVRL